MLNLILKGYIVFCIFVQTDLVMKTLHKHLIKSKVSIATKLGASVVIAIMLSVSFAGIGALFSFLVNVANNLGTLLI